MTTSVADKDIRDALFDQIYDLASKDKDVVFITADADAFALKKFKNDFPERFINVGVAEQSMINAACGLALSGKKVFIYSIIPFMVFRCYELVKLNICGMQLPVTMIGLGAGMSFGFDGPSHHGVHDIAVMRILPEINIFNPCDSNSAAASARLSYSLQKPSFIRLDKGKFPEIYKENDDFDEGIKVVRTQEKINILATGFMTSKAIEAADILKKDGINAGIIDVLKLRPVNKEKLIPILKSSRMIYTVEENSIVGGLGTIVSEILVDSNINVPLKKIGLEDKQHYDNGTREWLHDHYGISAEKIAKRIKNGE